MPTPILGMPILAASQAVPEETVNEIASHLEIASKLFAFKDRDLATPPGSPAELDTYLVAASPTGAWTGHASEIAFYLNGAWEFIVLREGFTAWVEDENVLIVYDGAAWQVISDSNAAGLYTIPIMASAMASRTTTGAAQGTSETTTNKIMLRTLDFDASTDEFAQFMIPMPKRWNEGTVTAIFYWTASATGDVVWGMQGVAISNDDVLDAAFGTAQTVTDSVTAANDMMVSAATSAITIGGTPAENDLVVFQVYRDADNGNDTLAADAKLIGIKLLVNTNARDDS
jgi:Protein of unknown function (DUF2793)